MNAPPSPAWDDAVPDPSSRYIPIVIPKRGNPLRLGVVGSRLHGVYTHWIANPMQSGGGRTVPHTVPQGDCEVCQRGKQLPRWHGYLACWQKAFRRFVVADLSTYAVQTCPQLHPASGVDLRGWELLLTRDGDSANSRVRAELSPCAWDLSIVQPAFDVVCALCRVWGLRPDDHRREGNG